MRQALVHFGPPLGVGTVLGVIGPFGTYDLLAWPARLGYWLSVVAVNWLLCDLAIRRLDAWLSNDMPARGILVPLIGSVLVALPATAVVYMAGSIAGLEPGSVLGLFWKVVLVCAVVSIVFYLNAPDEQEQQPPAPLPSPGSTDTGAAPGSEAATGSLFFQRLERPLSGDLLCLQMQDHYLAVHTTEGEQLVLCRMEDAVRELGSLGRRVHRSWWVADAAIAGVERHNGRRAVRLIDGRSVPVGRTYRQSVETLAAATT